MKELSKQLPVNHSLMKSYPRHAYCMSILATHEKCLPWVYCNYIQLYCNTAREMDKDWFDYYVLDPLGNFNPWFYTTNAHLTRDILAMQPSIVQFIINSIDSGYYIIAHLDDYYIPASTFYQTVNKPHGNLIFGYDLQEKTFDMAGFYKHKMYQNTKVTFEDFERAYAEAGKWVNEANSENVEFEYMNYVNYMHLMKVNEKGQFDFDLQCVLEQLEDYLYSRNTSERYRVRENVYEGVFGLQVYGYITSLLEAFLQMDAYARSQISFDMRPFYILTEHKKLMVARIQYMIDQGISADLVRFRDAFEDLSEQLLYIQQTCIRFMLEQGKNDSYIRKIIQKLPEITEKERITLVEMIETLRTKLPLHSGISKL